MERKWQERFLNMAREASTWSRDPSTKVGCVIVDRDKNVRSMGCNGFPRSIVDAEERFNDRDLKYKIIQHAESNAIVNCARTGTPTNGCAIYSTHFPCTSCAGKIIQAGICEIVINKEVFSSDFMTRWEEDIKLAKIILQEANLIIVEF